jgi:hypothetical protein
MTGSTPSRRSLVLVVGSGRSGTSVFSGLLQRLGFHVPQPEVPPDESNPRGFAESQWVVDFHTKLLKDARVQTADARPAAWAETAAVAENAVGDLRSFLRRQFATADDVLIKDPRLAWYLPLWRRCAAELGVDTRFVTLLRHPAAVVASKSRHYGSWQGDVSRTAGWVNTMLYTERATRGELRAFVRYDDLLSDWTRVVGDLGERLRLRPVTEATPGMIRTADEFVDPSLHRSPAAWEPLGLPPELQEQAERVWELFHALADKEDAADGDELLGRLDEEREQYARFYRRAEAVAESSVNAAVRASQRRSSRLLEKLVAKWVPDRYRRRIPVRWRRAVLAVLGQRRR